MNRRSFLRLGAAPVLSAGLSLRAQTPRPNIVLVFADDLGYGDLSCYGSKIKTPNIDGLASQGVLFRNFYSASSVCTPSRAALMTGRYPAQNGMTRVLFPDDAAGLPQSEVTMAEMLSSAGYRTMCAGKWHLGCRRPYLPTDRGFGQFIGIPYSSDMYPLPLLRNTEVVEETAKLETFIERCTEESVRFIRDSSDKPFFLYMAPALPHLPLTGARRFRSKSGLGPYGDAVQEIDWSVGEVWRTLRESGLEENTLLVVTSDNGPWYEGSAGPLRGRKADTWEGGMRVPCVASMPGRVRARSCDAVATTMDLLPTFASLCQGSLPAANLDGINIWPLLSGDVDWIEREALLYFYGEQLQCARVGKWKLHVARNSGVSWGPMPQTGFANLPLPVPELYDLDNDPGENYDVSTENPYVVSFIQDRIRTRMATFPASVQKAYQDTLNRKVLPTPPGALPIERR